MDFPITSGYGSVSYTHFVSSFIKNSENILVSQSMCNGYFCGCFAPLKMYYPAPARTWGIRKNYDDFSEFVDEQWKSTDIYSLACDENFGFGVFFMANYGTSQTIVTNTSDIEEEWNEGFKITAYAARGSTFYIIMTKDTEEYKHKAQAWFTRNTWTGARDEIQTAHKKGKAITGICYSTGLEQYFVVMTETSERQTYKWFEPGTSTKWMDEQYEEGYHPTVVFKDPTDNKTLVVMTRDKNRSGSVSRFNYELK